jgi:hypothetical protein
LEAVTESDPASKEESMRQSLATVALLVLVPAAARAAEPTRFCGVEAPPLLYTIKNWRAPSITPVIHTITQYIQQGGSVVAVSSPRLPGSDLPANTFVVSGQGRPDHYRDLLAALGAIHVGFQRDCWAPPINNVEDAEEETRITWYGRGRRRNTFLVTSRDRSLPACPPEMTSLLNTLEVYTGDSTGVQSLPAL